MAQPPYTENQKAASLLHQPGLAKVTYPNDDLAYPVVTRELTVAAADKELAFLTADTEYTNCLLISQPCVAQDHAHARVIRTFERIPGPLLVSSRIDPEDGSTITETRQTVLTSAAGPVTASGTTSTRYEPRGDSDIVSTKITTTTAYDGVVRSLPARVDLRLPGTLAVISVDFVPTKGDGQDDGLGVALTATGDNWSVRNNASGSSSGSLAVQPEVFLPIRSNKDAGTDFPALVKQVYLTGAITEAAICARLTAVYEVIVTGTVAAGTYLGNASNVNGVIWFSLGTRKISWTAGVWSLGTDAEILAGNYWKRTAAATAWLGTYAPQGAASGTATVAVGRTVQPWPRWGTEEVNLVTKGPQVSVRSNASASEDVSKSGGVLSTVSTSQNIGKSVSVGGNQSRIRVEPTLHGAIWIAKSTYTDSVNATATAALTPISPLTFTGVDSGFPGGTKPYGNAQFVTSYVRFSAVPATVTPPALTISGNTVANPTIVHTSTPHNLLSGQAVTITGSNSTPVINGSRIVTVTDTTHFSVAVNVTILGTAGTVQGPAISSATYIPPTVPADVMTSGLWLLPGFETSGKDAQYVQVHGTIVDMVNFLAAPTFLAYSDPNPTYYQGIAITPNQPYFLPSGGTPASYAISPSIPSGLAFSTSTGIITGSPNGSQVATTYTVTATNAINSTTGTVTITVSL